ncbi:MAG: hypothetical protein BMS9Abin28_1140 [Anaerolineae bacterium]|nr:MAG: hypothetical protein BMS9Abin28_1140 [Anaerolineae bacterium]
MGLIPRLAPREGLLREKRHRRATEGRIINLTSSIPLCYFLKLRDWSGGIMHSKQIHARNRWVVLSCVTFLWLVSCETLWSIRGFLGAEDETSIALVVMTYNIFRKRHDDQTERRWNNRRDLVVENIGRVSPDVFGLQEALRIQIDYIQSQLPEYRWYGVGRDNGESAGEHVPIFYRKDRFHVDAEGTFWFSNTPDTPSIGGSDWGNPTVKRISSWVRLVETNTSKSFYFFNLHLESERSGQHSRERSVALLGKKIRDRAHPEDPVIVAGDFNMLPENSAMRYFMATLGYGDDYTALEEIPDDEYTYQSWGSGSRYRLDYILSSPDTLWARSTVNHRSGSDHYPVVTRLLLATAAQD